MRRNFVLSLLCLAAGFVTACDVDEVVETQAFPTAGVRFINAVPDTGSMDFRFIDIPESNPHWDTPFRNNVVTTNSVPASTKWQYKAARAGERQFRIFMYGTTIPVASTVVFEGTHTFEADRNYTVLIWGYANPTGPGRPAGAPALQVEIFEEAVPDPGAAVALRVINASMDAIDVRHYESGQAVPASATWGAVPAMSISGYVTADTGLLRFNVRPAGSSTNLFRPVADALALRGEAATTVGFDPLPGTLVPGSAVTAIVYPGSVVGSQAPQTGQFIVTTGSTALSATAAGYMRPAGAGSFITEGFDVGQQITASGFANAANNGPSVVAAIREVTTGSIAMSATATGYARTTGSFVTNGFVVGDSILAAGFTTAANNGRSLVTAVIPLAITVTKTPQTVAEAAGTSTSRSLTVDPLLTVTKTPPTVPEATNTGRNLIGPPRPAISFIWDRRPPRPPGT